MYAVIAKVKAWDDLETTRVEKALERARYVRHDVSWDSFDEWSRYRDKIGLIIVNPPFAKVHLYYIFVSAKQLNSPYFSGTDNNFVQPSGVGPLAGLDHRCSHSTRDCPGAREQRGN